MLMEHTAEEQRTNEREGEMKSARGGGDVCVRASSGGLVVNLLVDCGWSMKAIHSTHSTLLLR